MAIPKLNSKDLNGILKKAQDKIIQMQADVDNIKADTSEKMTVLKNEQEYAISELLRMSSIIEQSQDENRLRGVRNKIVLSGPENLLGTYDKYGTTIHRKFLRQPVNVFNLMTTNGPMFRDNVEVSINGEKRERFKQMLMHTAVPDKGISFGEYNSPNLKMEITVDTTNLLGDTNFNVIEIDPYLAGSFHIKSLRVFDIHRDALSNEPEFEVKDLKRVGPSRFVLDRKFELLKIEIDIELQYKNQIGLYPFGIKHMYFLNADFDPSSYIIAKVEKDKFIETINDNIFIRDQHGRYETTATDEDIKLYLSETNGVLEYELETSRHQEVNTISRNTREFYARIPLQNSAIVSIEFASIETR
ncbi:hypothetical protein [Bacillus atrophaeus]|uniref:hypothetical protein n=1 Tax=Bacillus atrophaeus TaxID=1452 RepID=UPI002E1FE5C8|nr:hypothetical protein [Bacillus atrophaeus]